ncbi:MAG: ABC transporter ATP-binding protein [Lachnospiraceae bacterium]|nr:ABC transporter ATP-binding protein [Lachnospiraceae bacterium]
MGDSGKTTERKKRNRSLRFQTNTGLILFFLKGSYLYFLAGAVFACLVALFDLIIPRMIQFTVDAVIGGNTGSVPGWAAGFVNRFGGAGFLSAHLWAAALAIAGAAALGAVCRYCFKVSNAKGAETFVRRMRDQLFRHIMSLPYAWHGENSTGDTIQRCTSDVETIKIFVSEQLTSLLRVFILVFMSLYFMATIQPRLTLAAAVFIPIMIISSLIFYGLIGNEFETVDSEEGRLSAITQENLTGVRVVRTFGREQFERERFEKQNEFYTNHWIRLMRVLAAFWVSGNVIATVRNMTVAVYGAVLCVQDRLTAGGLIAFLSYNALMSLPVRGIGRVIADMSKAGVSLDRLRYIMNVIPEEETGLTKSLPAEITYAPDQVPMDRDIEFSHVSFRYNENSPWVLRDLSMKIRAGTTVGILGATGSGKTTLALLLDRLWELPEGCGRISIGGRDIRTIDRGWLRKNIGMVQQEPYLFSRTLVENIAIAMPEPEWNPGDEITETEEEQLMTEEARMHEIRRAAGIARLDETVERFADGYDTFVGERGVTLSGGQKQRAAIARMLVRRTPVMIFDDSLSAVDAETDAQIRRELRNNISGATVILIAHRITTLQHADEIFVLENGRISEHGTHEQLIAKGGHYSRVNALQTGGKVQ